MTLTPVTFDDLNLQPRNGAVRLGVHVRPRASRQAILGVRNGSLAVAVTAPPADGAANADVIELLAKSLDLPRRDVEVVVGPKSREKVIEVAGISPEELRARLERATQ